MADNIWCPQHRKLDEAHPLIAEALDLVQHTYSGVREAGQRRLDLVAAGLCPFCDQSLITESEFEAWHQQWNDDHRNACYCAECGEEHTDFSRSNGIAIAACGGRWRPLGLHPTKFRNHAGHIVDISNDAAKLAEHHDVIRFGTIWHTDGAPRHVDPEYGKKYHALVKGHPVVQ